HCSPGKTGLFEHGHMSIGSLVFRPTIDQFQRPAQISDRFAICVAKEMILRRHAKVGHRSTVIVSVFKMHRELGGNIRGELTKELFAALTDSLMKQRTPTRRDSVVEHLLKERMNERVASGHAAVGKRVDSNTPDKELLPLELLALFLNTHEALIESRRTESRSLESRRYGDRRKLDSGDRGNFEQSLLVPIDPLDLLFDHLSDAVGHAKFQIAQLNRQTPTAVAFRDQALRLKVVDCVHEKEGIAVRSLMKQRRQSVGQGVVNISPLEVARDRLLVEVLKRKLLTEPVCLQFLFHSLQRMIAYRDIHRAVGQNQHHPRRLSPPCKIRNQVERRVVAPMQVFDQKDERRRGRESLEDLGDFSQHSFRRGPDHRPLQALAVLVRHKPRQLLKPRRSLPPKQLDEGLVPRLLTQAGHGFEHRQVCLTRAVLLETLSS